MQLRGFNHNNNNKKEKSTTITSYYRDVTFWSDMRLQKKEDTSPIFLGKPFRNYIRLLPKPSYPALLLQDATLRGYRLCGQQKLLWCDSDSGPIMLEKLLRTHIFIVGPSLAR